MSDDEDLLQITIGKSEQKPPIPERTYEENAQPKFSGEKPPLPAKIPEETSAISQGLSRAGFSGGKRFMHQKFAEEKSTYPTRLSEERFLAAKLMTLAKFSEEKEARRLIEERARFSKEKETEEKSSIFAKISQEKENTKEKEDKTSEEKEAISEKPALPARSIKEKEKPLKSEQKTKQEGPYKKLSEDSGPPAKPSKSSIPIRQKSFNESSRPAIPVKRITMRAVSAEQTEDKKSVSKSANENVNKFVNECKPPLPKRNTKIEELPMDNANVGKEIHINAADKEEIYSEKISALLLKKQEQKKIVELQEELNDNKKENFLRNEEPNELLEGKELQNKINKIQEQVNKELHFLEIISSREITDDPRSNHAIPKSNESSSRSYNITAEDKEFAPNSNITTKSSKIDTKRKEIVARINEVPSKSNDLPSTPFRSNDFPFSSSKSNDFPFNPFKSKEYFSKSKELPLSSSISKDLPSNPFRSNEFPFAPSKSNDFPFNPSKSNEYFSKSNEFPSSSSKSNDFSSRTNEFPSSSDRVATNSKFYPESNIAPSSKNAGLNSNDQAFGSNNLGAGGNLAPRKDDFAPSSKPKIQTSHTILAKSSSYEGNSPPAEARIRPILKKMSSQESSSEDLFRNRTKSVSISDKTDVVLIDCEKVNEEELPELPKKTPKKKSSGEQFSNCEKVDEEELPKKKSNSEEFSNCETNQQPVKTVKTFEERGEEINAIAFLDDALQQHEEGEDRRTQQNAKEKASFKKTAFAISKFSILNPRPLEKKYTVDNPTQESKKLTIGNESKSHSPKLESSFSFKGIFKPKSKEEKVAKLLDRKQNKKPPSPEVARRGSPQDTQKLQKVIIPEAFNKTVNKPPANYVVFNMRDKTIIDDRKLSNVKKWGEERKSTVDKNLNKDSNNRNWDKDRKFSEDERYSEDKSKPDGSKNWDEDSNRSQIRNWDEDKKFSKVEHNEDKSKPDEIKNWGEDSKRSQIKNWDEVKKFIDDNKKGKTRNWTEDSLDGNLSESLSMSDDRKLNDSRKFDDRNLNETFEERKLNIEIGLSSSSPGFNLKRWEDIKNRSDLKSQEEPQEIQTANCYLPEDLESFSIIKYNLLIEEWNFIQIYKDVRDNSCYKKIKEENSNKAVAIFGDVDGLLRFHNDFVGDLNKIVALEQFLKLMVQHEKQFTMHVRDQWKKCQESSSELLEKEWNISPIFCMATQNQVKKYLDEMHKLQHSKEQDFSESTIFKRVMNILLETYTQIEYINHALKFITGANIVVKDCGRVIYKEKIPIRSEGFAHKHNDYDIFFTQKYIILTQAKGKFYNFRDSLPMEDVIHIPNRNKMKVQISLRNVEKKILYSLYPTREDVFEKVLSAISLARINVF